MDNTTPSAKEQLAAAIEAYAAARASGNNILLRFAADTLSSFLDDVDVSFIKKEEQETVPMTLPNS